MCRLSAKMNGSVEQPLWKMPLNWKLKSPSPFVNWSTPVKRNTTTIIWLTTWPVSIWRNNCTVNVNWLVNWAPSRRWWRTMVLWVNSYSTRICKRRAYFPTPSTKDSVCDGCFPSSSTPTKWDFFVSLTTKELHIYVKLNKSKNIL